MRIEYGKYIEEAKKEEDDLEDIIEDPSPSTHDKKRIEPTSKEFVINSLPRFKGSISDSFEQYMKSYVEKEEWELKEGIKKSIQNDNFDPTSDEKIFESSLLLFKSFK